MGHLDGIENIEPRNSFELAPYLAGSFAGGQPEIHMTAVWRSTPAM